MANQQGDIRYIIEVDAAGAITKIEQFEGSVTGLGHATKQTGSMFSMFGDQFKQMTASWVSGQIVFDTLQKIWGTAKAELKDTVNKAIEAEQANRNLESTLESVGEVSESAASSVKLYTEALMQKTVFDDEEIKNAAALIIQMRGTTEQYQEATRGAIGLATVYNMDLSSAARAVAQGYSGNYRQLGMMIPAIRQARSEEEKHSIMMRELAKDYLKAEDRARTFGGSVTQLKNSYAELKEGLGAFVTQNAEVIESLGAVKSIIDLITRSIPADVSKLKVMGDVLAVFNQTLGLVKNLSEGVQWAGKGAKAIMDEMDMSAYKASMSAYDWEASMQAVGGMSQWVTQAVLGMKEKAVDPLPNSFKVLTKTVQESVEKLDQFASRNQWIAALGGQHWAVPEQELGDYSRRTLIEKQQEWLGIWKKDTQKTIRQQDQMFAGFFNDVSQGFANAFANMKFTLQGFADFFVAIWQSIKQAVFKIIGEIVARFLIFKVLFKLLGAVLPGFGDFMGSIGMNVIPAQAGFEGTVTRPTLFLTGEGYRPETVSIQPTDGRGGRGGSSVYNVNFTVHAIDAAGVESFLRYRARPVLLEMLAHGELRA